MNSHTDIVNDDTYLVALGNRRVVGDRHVVVMNDGISAGQVRALGLSSQVFSLVETVNMLRFGAVPEDDRRTVQALVRDGIVVPATNDVLRRLIPVPRAVVEVVRELDEGYEVGVRSTNVAITLTEWEATILAQLGSEDSVGTILDRIQDDVEAVPEDLAHITSWLTESGTTFEEFLFDTTRSLFKKLKSHRVLSLEPGAAVI